MRWPSRFFITFVLAAAPAGAGPVDDAIARATRLVAAGQPADALRVCREARVEHPDAPELLFAIGCMAAAAGEQMASGDPAVAADHLRAAREMFAWAASAAPEAFAAASAYNAATCLLMMDATIDPRTGYDERVANLRAAVAELEACAARSPELERARRNLDHARYRLNTLLQNPPRDPEEDEERSEDKLPGEIVAVESVTTAIPGATAEVVDGSTVVLRPGGAEADE
ncbi:MAG: hypothetical protein KF886_17325 [Candidatus Hydrogenedentes bacterium]|nr:hypothetical protein [Candidatus Hydrogenedentota bacterium]